MNFLPTLFLFMSDGLATESLPDNLARVIQSSATSLRTLWIIQSGLNTTHIYTKIAWLAVIVLK